MIPSLLNEISVPYREKIARIEAQWETVDNEIGMRSSRTRPRSVRSVRMISGINLCI